MKKSILLYLFFSIFTSVFAQNDICTDISAALNNKGSAKRNRRMLTENSMNKAMKTTTDIDTSGHVHTKSHMGMMDMESIYFDSVMYTKIGNQKWSIYKMSDFSAKKKDNQDLASLTNAIKNCKRLADETIDKITFRVYTYDMDFEKLTSPDIKKGLQPPVQIWVSPKNDVYKTIMSFDDKSNKGTCFTITIINEYDVVLNIEKPLDVETKPAEKSTWLKGDMPKTNANGAYYSAEEQPEFQGGIRALFQYLNDNIKYPSEARKNGIEGTVYLGFVVDKEGVIKDIEVKRGIGQLLDAEAVRVVKTMPKWKAGKNEGKAVETVYTLPVKFKL